jgi:hypothetical protein
VSEEREKELLRLAEAVSDGTPVDWEREQGTHPGIKQPLEHLAVLDQVRRVHEESSRVMIAAAAKADASRKGAAAGAAPASRPRRWIVWVVVALVLAAVAVAALLYSNATKAAM